MSTDAAADHGHAHDVLGCGTKQSYLIGFGAATVLSAIAFFLTKLGGVGGLEVTELLLIVLAIARVIVHMLYFVRINAMPEEGWTMMSLIFTAIVIVIAILGTMWVMHSLDVHVMPGVGMGMGHMP